MSTSQAHTYNGKIYFASDFHLGMDGKLTSNDRERLICQWLESIKDDAAAIFLVGDIFDYWFEYKQVIPRGFSTFWATIRKLRDQQVPIIFFTGNHDMWMFNYATEEYGIPIYSEPQTFIFNGKKVLIHHGDGLGPGDYGYKFIKTFTKSKICQWLFARFHPNFALGIMKLFSGTSRSFDKERPFDESSERLIQYCEGKIRSTDLDFLIFGHRHLVIDHLLSNQKSRYINLGDWLNDTSFLEIDIEKYKLKKYA